ncbi:hypothetical protein ACGVWS_03700 [Enterobacteriaceae bacterium LUAb1]
MKFLYIWKDAYIYEDEHKGERRINISAHGHPVAWFFAPEIGNRAIYINDRPCFPADIFNLLTKTQGFMKVKTVRVLSCHSGEGDKNSFACQLSRHINNVDIKGYKGSIMVDSSDEDVFFFYKEQLKIFDNHQALLRTSDYFFNELGGLIFYKNSEYLPNHQTTISITYRNGEEIKESIYTGPR